MPDELGITIDQGLVPDRPATRRRPRLTIGRLMIAIAGCAVALAILPSTIAAPYLIVPGGIVGLIAVVALLTETTWVEAAAWASAAYPLGGAAALYGTWLIAGASLGHVPRAALDDPKQINAAVSSCHVLSWMWLFGSYPTLVACLGTIIIGTAFPGSWGRERRGRVGVVAGLAFFAWSGVFLLLATDPGGVLFWFFD